VQGSSRKLHGFWARKILMEFMGKAFVAWSQALKIVQFF
jgi:hypothetical protein